MRTAISAITLFSFLTFFNVDTMANPPSNLLPPGNYTATCSACQINHKTLSCNCRNEAGFWVPSTTHVANHCADVENNNGQLECEHYRHHRWRHRHWGHHHHRYFDVSAGPIWNNDDAGQKCPNTCSNQDAEWTGQWRTVQEAFDSICQCRS